MARARTVRREEWRVANLRRRSREYSLCSARSDQRWTTSASWKSPGGSRPTIWAPLLSTTFRPHLSWPTASFTRPPVRAERSSRSMPPPGEMRWMYSLNEGKRGDAAPRKLSGRGLSYWTDGKEERIIYVTPGYQMIALDSKTGRPVPGFGRNGSRRPEEGHRSGSGSGHRRGRTARRADRGRQHGDHRCGAPVGRRDRRAGAMSRGSSAGTTCGRASASGSSTRCHHPASSETTHGRTTRGRIPATPESGDRCRSTRNLEWCISP